MAGQIIWKYKNNGIHNISFSCTKGMIFFLKLKETNFYEKMQSICSHVSQKKKKQYLRALFKVEWPGFHPKGHMRISQEEVQPINII